MLLLFSPRVAAVIDVSLFCLFVLPRQNQPDNSHSAATLALHTKQQGFLQLRGIKGDYGEK